MNLATALHATSRTGRPLACRLLANGAVVVAFGQDDLPVPSMNLATALHATSRTGRPLACRLLANGAVVVAFGQDDLPVTVVAPAVVREISAWRDPAKGQGDDPTGWMRDRFGRVKRR